MLFWTSREQSGGGPEDGKRKKEDKDVRLANLEESVEMACLKMDAINHISSNTCKAHVAVLRQLMPQDVPMQTVVSNLGYDDLVALQNVVSTSGREDSRIQAIVKVLFASDIAEITRLKKVITTMDEGCSGIVKYLFFIINCCKP